MSRLAEQRAPGMVIGCQVPRHDSSLASFIMYPRSNAYKVETIMSEFYESIASDHAILDNLFSAITSFLNPNQVGGTIVHNDLTVENLLWRPGSVKAQVIDFSGAASVEALSKPEDLKLFFKDVLKEFIQWCLHADFLVASAAENDSDEL